MFPVYRSDQQIKGSDSVSLVEPLLAGGGKSASQVVVMHSAKLCQHIPTKQD